MNLRQPYEQLIADKLRQLRAPDANASWQQMKQLLDDDEDTKGGGGRRRPPGNNGLWRIGILAIVLSASFWLYVEKSPSSNNSLSKNSKAVTPQADNKTSEASKNISNNNQTATIDKTTTLTTSDADKSTNTIAGNAAGSTTSNTNATDKSAATVLTKSIHNSTSKTSAGVNTGTNSVTPLATPGNTANTTVAPVKHGAEKISANIAGAGDKVSAKNIFAGAVTSTSLQKNKPNRPLSASNGSYDEIARGLAAENADENDNNKINTVDLSISQQHNRKTKAGNGKSKKNNNIFGDDAAFTNAGDNSNQIARNNLNPVNQANSSKDKTWFERLTGLRVEEPTPTFNTSLATGDSVINNRDVSNLLTSETKKGIAKAKRDKEIAALDKQDKKFHLNLSNLFKPFSMRIDAEPWWAAGIALNAPITINAQNRFNYNMNAKSGTLTDYIPSPYLQFHLNNYVYFQTELNFITPQYTPQLLIDRQNNDISAQMAGTSQQKSIYVQKMYYFNWPVSLHYSPISNLFFSGGIQFSSFQSGLATIEEKQYPTVLGIDHSNSISSTTLKFKDDSIAAKIAPNEWRWQVGAEYYINRFSVGLRYNQSFKNAINTTVLPGMAPTVSRNQSLLFFVRYNLFESRQKNSVPKNQ